MPPKAKLPAPIDRPLSRAYLRKFGGWSTAYPPGVSEPNSLRVMENMLVNRDGSVKVRPGLRYLSYDGESTLDPELQLVGSHETFFLEDGSKAYLFAVREPDGTVGFRVAAYNSGGGLPLQVMDVHAVLPYQGADPADLRFSEATTYVKYLQIDNKILALSNAGESSRFFNVGATKLSKVPQALTRPVFTWVDAPGVYLPKPEWVNNPPTITDPTITSLVPAVPTSKTLLLTPAEIAWLDAADRADVQLNVTLYNMGYFYTFSNEFGESAPSTVVTAKVRRRWSAWRMVYMNSASEPDIYSNTIDNPLGAADQLVIIPAPAAYTKSVEEGATHFNVYGMTWSDQDPVPVEGTLIGSYEIKYNTDGTPISQYHHVYVRHTPAAPKGGASMPLPTEANRYNYSAPTRAGQGLVAADRMILVYDPTEAAVIKWSSNQMGENTVFSSGRGGGYKTLTSGNLNVPACVKLWQNPQSADTITVLCLGVDGYSTSYYMAPAQVASQSDATNIMGFEETTATQGTTSPYGVEVHNNTLYHPVEHELTKSTASNYNINHKSMTDLITNRWSALVDKDKIVSSQHDNRLYFLVHNPLGAELEAGCWGNEVWVLDVGSEGGSWSRWLVQGQSLRKIMVDDRVLMSLSRPDGLYAFDPSKTTDDYVVPGRNVEQRPIPWKMETNTQGANRSHDAWAHLRQASINVGNFEGTLRYGVRGWDLHGKPVVRSKVCTAREGESLDQMPYDLEDHLQVARDMKEWFFFAESVEDDEGYTLPGTGQVTLVQYRYTPVSVNVGYEYGSVETFEYGRSTLDPADGYSDNGVPIPAIDTRRP